MIKDVDKFDRAAEYDQMKAVLELVGFHEDVPLEYNNLSELIGARQGILEEFLNPEQIRKLKLIPKIAAEMMKNEAKKGRLAETPQAAMEIFSEYVALDKFGQEYEALYTMFLDTKNRVIDIKRISDGTVDHVPVYIRKIISNALKYDASAILICHNHPSGSTDMSAQDINANGLLQKACDTIGIRLLDFIVIAGNKYKSTADNFQERKVAEKISGNREMEIPKEEKRQMIQPVLLEKKEEYKI